MIYSLKIPTFIINDLEVKNIKISYCRHPEKRDMGKAYVFPFGRLCINKPDEKEFSYTFSLFVNTKTEEYKKLKTMLNNQFYYKENTSIFKRIYNFFFNENANFSHIIFDTNQGLRVESSKAYFKEYAKLNKEKNEAIFRIWTADYSVKETISEYEEEV